MRTVKLFTLAATSMLFVGDSLSAQQAREPLPAETSSASVKGPTASLEERIAAAQSVKVIDSILGIALGSELDEAHEKLDPLCTPGTRPKEEGGDEEERKATPGADEGEGHKVLWQLSGTDYSAVYIKADDRERILSITGVLRAGREVPFDQIGEVAKAPVHDDQAVVWDVLRPGQPLCRVLAKGVKGKAATLTLFVAKRPSAFDSHHPTEQSNAKAD